MWRPHDFFPECEENDLIGSKLSFTAPCEIQDFDWLLLAQVFPGSANDYTTASVSHACSASTTLNMIRSRIYYCVFVCIIG